MIRFYEDLVKPIEDTLNAALSETDGAGYVYGVNDVPQNYFYAFNFATDTGDFAHAHKETVEQHEICIFPINCLAKIQPVSREGIASEAYNAVVDATTHILLPLLTEGTVERDFVNEFRRLVDTALQSSAQRIVSDGSIPYSVTTNYRLLQTGERDNRNGVGDSVEFTLFLEFSIVASGISSDLTEFYIDTSLTSSPSWSRIYYDNLAISRKAIKELGTLSTATAPSALSFASSSVFGVSLILAARFNALTPVYNEWLLNGTAGRKKFKIKKPKSVAIQTTAGGIEATFAYDEIVKTMWFDDGGSGHEPATVESQSITLVEVP